jgi:tyrosinase
MGGSALAALRSNILTDENARKRYAEGVRLLKQEFLGPTTADLQVAGPAEPVSTYDLFLAWHHVAMNTFTPPGQTDRNAAHRGPVFLPWHRYMLLLFELQLQRVLGDQDFGLPYWDWAADGDLDPSQQPASPIWAVDAMGGDGDPVSDGPFAFDAADANSWRVRLDIDPSGRLRTNNRGLRRQLASAPTLPTRTDAADVLGESPYDEPPWGTLSQGFRNRLEGWRGPGLHNLVHVWVSGDMLLSTSPNDPVFYLNHCNVDRIWAAWQETSPDPSYLPDQSAPSFLQGHRLDDDMHSLLTTAVTPRQMLDPQDFYTYDTLQVS